MQTNNQPKLTLIGAGPGDPDLLTVKGMKALQTADVVLYDALVNPQLLEYAPQAECVFVGKRKGCYVYQQDQINELIVSRAKSSGHVVRLKGGDPFVFGRGSEELEYVISRGISAEFIPGISSALAVPASQNIPLTQRGMSESFWVITGTTKEHKLSKDVALAAKSRATVIILMGMGNLGEIVSLFKKEQKDQLPVAIIQNGTTEQEQLGIGTVDTIENIVSKKGLSNPAIIVIGEVVKQREILAKIKQTVEAV